MAVAHIMADDNLTGLGHTALLDRPIRKPARVKVQTAQTAEQLSAVWPDEPELTPPMSHIGHRDQAPNRLGRFRQAGQDRFFFARRQVNQKTVGPQRIGKARTGGRAGAHVGRAAAKDLLQGNRCLIAFNQQFTAGRTVK